MINNDNFELMSAKDAYDKYCSINSERVLNESKEQLKKISKLISNNIDKGRISFNGKLLELTKNELILKGYAYKEFTRFKQVPYVSFYENIVIIAWDGKEIKESE